MRNEVYFLEPYDADYGEGFINPPLTVVEQQLYALARAIREKDNWWEKMKDVHITKKWKTEAIDGGSSAEAFDFVLKELAWIHENRFVGPIRMSPVDGVYESDSCIEESLRLSLIGNAKRLWEVDPHLHDWHPGSCNKVLDLVHPSLFCIISGRTLVNPGAVNLKNCLRIIGSGSLHKFDVPKRPDPTLSPTYCWLPTPFHVSSEGVVTPLSYINNLHPKEHAPLYDDISTILQRMLPMFEMTLRDYAKRLSNRIHQDGPERPDGVVYVDYDEENDEEITTPAIQPDVPKDVPDEWKERAKEEPFNLKNQTLNVIVKMANLVLNPEDPNYGGGVWHVEGMKNERIVATGIYYYDIENISETRLAFRTTVAEPGYEQGDDRGCAETFALANEAPLNVDIGSIIARQGRCITFPNIYQHRVQPFNLIKPKESGNRRMLVFFLIDPTKPCPLTTADVPPQQSSWIEGEVGRWPPFNTLPSELLSMISQFSGWPMTWGEATAHREALMEERGKFVVYNTNEVFEREFSLCEH